jgi:hypothetical protein
MSEFGEVGEVTKLSWFGPSSYPALTCIWKINGHIVTGSESRVYEIQHTGTCIYMYILLRYIMGSLFGFPPCMLTFIIIIIYRKRM